jgi:hypothetical protein
MDFPAPCGTPVVALADGVVEYVDNFSFGSRPHNLIIQHPALGYAVMYGHLLNTPALVRGQPVQRGQVLAQTGDPDETCTSRPHLHLEVRLPNFRTALNPAALIEADWAALAMTGSFGGAPFAKDLYAPDRWQKTDDQPDIAFGGRQLNNYREVYPLPDRYEPPRGTLPGYLAPPLPADLVPTITRLTAPGCCSQAWWSPDSKSIRFWAGAEGQRAQIAALNLDGSPASVPQTEAIVLESPDGRYEARWFNGIVNTVDLLDEQTWKLSTSEAMPRFSPGSRWLLWQHPLGDSVPGLGAPQVEIWFSRIDGSERTRLLTMPGVGALWLDDDRLLLSVWDTRTNVLTMLSHELSTGKQRLLYQNRRVRGLSIAPGGEHIMFYLTFQEDPEQNGMYVMNTVDPAAAPRKLPFFGSYRWRDSRTVMYVPYEMYTPMRFMLLDVLSGEQRAVTDPAVTRVTIANNDWSIAPDGSAVMWWSADDYAVHVMPLK